MKILHIGAGTHFTKKMTYQDNLLSMQNVYDGNEVAYITDCYEYKNGKLFETEPCDEVCCDLNGMRLIRLAYYKYLISGIANKTMRMPKLYNKINEIRPDVILHHGTNGYNLLTVSAYKDNHPEVKLYCDAHADFNNSGKNFLSRYFLHGFYNRRIVQKSLKNIDKVFYLSYEALLFAKQMYKIPDNKLEYLPLGGIVFNDSIRENKRNNRRSELGLKKNDIMLLHTGKMNTNKRTLDIIKALKNVKSNAIKLVIAGQFSMDIHDQVIKEISEDDRIIYLGWKNSDELLEYLCASDLYVQPGGQSATMQNAVCCGSALALYPHPSHKYLLADSVFYIETVDDMAELFNSILETPEILEKKREKSYQLAKDKLDYKKIAERLYQ